MAPRPGAGHRGATTRISFVTSATPRQLRDVLERLVALELVVDVALERDPAVADLDVDRVRRHLDVPHQRLQRGAADLGVLAPSGVEEPHPQLVLDAGHAFGGARVGHRCPALREAADRPAQRHVTVLHPDRDLPGGWQASVRMQRGAQLRLDLEGVNHEVLLVGYGRTYDRVARIPRPRRRPADTSWLRRPVWLLRYADAAASISVIAPAGCGRE
jgi:hypothetical protein